MVRGLGFSSFVVLGFGVLRVMGSGFVVLGRMGFRLRVEDVAFQGLYLWPERPTFSSNYMYKYSIA